MSDSPPNIESKESSVSSSPERDMLEFRITEMLARMREHVDDKFNLLTRDIHMNNDSLRDEINLKLEAIRHETSTVGVALGRLQSHEGRLVKVELKMKAVGWCMLFVLFAGAIITIIVGSHEGWMPVIPQLQRHKIFDEVKPSGSAVQQ